MLDMTLKTEFEPGTNLKGDFACADWRFLLPTLDQGTILCIGLPSEGAIRVLSSLAENVFVVDPDKKTSKFENVKYLTRAELTKAQFSNESISLIYLVKDYKNFIEEDFGGKLLGKKGAIYFENNGWKGRQNASSLVKEFERHGLKAVDTFWLTPLKGDLRTAVPLQHNDISSYFFANVLYGQSFKNKMISRFGKSLSNVGMLKIITTKRAYLVRSSEGKKSLAVPDYIVDIAEKSGFDLSDMRIGLSARGKYNANKVIFFLFKNEACEPEAVIKMTRAPEFNYRLENENHVLRNLHDNQIVDAGTYPEPMFFGYHHDLALTCIKAVHGKPFRTRTKATEDCPYAQKALHWLVQLGTKSVNKQACSALEVAGYLHTLFQRFIEIWSGLPVLYLLIILASVIEPNFWLLLGLMLLFSWTALVGVVRAEFLRGRNLDYVRAARALGVSNLSIMFKHVLPNAMVATLTFLPFILSGSVVTLTSLDFLGFGLPVGSPSLGELLAQGKSNLHAPWLGISSFLVLATMLSLLIFIGEAVRDAFDPRKIMV